MVEMINGSDLTLIWILSLVKFAIFSSVLAYTVLLNKVSNIKEVRHFSLSMFFFAFSSVFEILEVMQTDNTLIADISQFGIQLSLFVAGTFLVKFFYAIDKNAKKFR
ncbi:MAG TPA: hypothetical protein VI912_01730 [Candidatus Bilamarchaeaceae archaeon]|nr:hypothetical protein [Candidatus Bilamarchaeaceae archaeon]